MNIENIPVLKDLVNFWKNLEKNQKRNIIVVLVVALVAIGGLVYYLNRPQYALLFSDLMPEQAQAIVSQLESQMFAISYLRMELLFTCPKIKLPAYVLNWHLQV